MVDFEITAASSGGGMAFFFVITDFKPPLPQHAVVTNVFPMTKGIPQESLEIQGSN